MSNSRFKRQHCLCGNVCVHAGACVVIIVTMWVVVLCMGVALITHSKNLSTIGAVSVEGDKQQT